MTTKFISTDTTGPIFVDPGDEIFVLPDVNVTSDRSAFNFTEPDNGFKSLNYEITVAGDVFSRFDFASHRFSSSAVAFRELNISVNIGLDASIYTGDDFVTFSAPDPGTEPRTLSVNNAGFVSVAGTAVSAFGFSSVRFTNSGTLTQVADVSKNRLAVFENLGDSGVIQNDGLIQSTASTSVIDHGFGSFKSLRLTNTGTIDGQSGVAFELFGPDAIFLVENSGTIFGDLETTTQLKFLNSGIYSGDIRPLGADDKLDNVGVIFGVISLRGGTDTLNNSGQIFGDVFLGVDDDKLVNTDVINGMVDLGAGDDVVKILGNGLVSDVIYGRLGNDTLNGGRFDDTIDGGEGDDLLRGKNGDDDLTGGAGNDTLSGGNDDDLLIGGGDKDDLRGGRGDDSLRGGGGNDELSGGNGNDTLEGGLDKDTLIGGAGNDTLIGQSGQDVLIGGAGTDLFVFSNLSHSAVGSDRDAIRDFKKGQDKINIDGLSSDTFVFLGDDALGGTGDAEVRVTTNAGGNSIVRIDADGDGTADSEILVRGVTDLEAGDFIL